jgi:hypothetical protein
MEMLVEGPGLVLVSVRFRIDSTNDPDRTVDGVPHTAQTTVVYENVGKTFTVTLPKMGGGYPAQMLACVPKVAVLAATDTGDIDYVVDSYDSSTGAFTLVGSVANVASALTDNTEVHVLCMLRKSATLAQT